jgi:hypothetical protein
LRRRHLFHLHDMAIVLATTSASTAMILTLSTMFIPVPAKV